jgi:hypothetical protein
MIGDVVGRLADQRPRDAHTLVLAVIIKEQISVSRCSAGDPDKAKG